MFVLWIKKLAYLSIFLTLIILILPNGKIGIYIKGIFTIIVFSFILQPVMNIKNADFDFMSFYSESIEEENKYQDEYLSLIFENKNKKNIELIQKLLEEYGFKESFVDLKYSVDNGFYKITRCSIKIKEYIDKDKHKDIIEKIKENVSLVLSIKKTDIWIFYE